MNQYLATVTGIQLNYDVVPRPKEEPPATRVRTPSHISPSPCWPTPDHLHQPAFMPDGKDWRLRSADFKDSSKCV